MKIRRSDRAETFLCQSSWRFLVEEFVSWMRLYFGLWIASYSRSDRRNKSREVDGHPRFGFYFVISLH